MQKIEIVKATEKDTDLLIKIRIDLLHMDYSYMSEETIERLKKQLVTYFPKHLKQDDLVVLMLKEDEKIASAAFMAIIEKPANPDFITGVTGAIFNVVTYPEYRRKGYAKMIVEALVKEAESRGISMIELSATKEGKSLYDNMGFVLPISTYMRKYLIKTDSIENE